jgi:hypothetical protein
MWSEKEVFDLRNLFPKESVQKLIGAFPMRTWDSIQAKARRLGLRRPDRIPLSSSLRKEGDVGFCAGMIIADGSVLETCISSGIRRAKHEGGAPRARRYYSIPQVRISMEDRESLDQVARLWGRKTTFCQKSSTGNDVYSVQIGGQKAKELLSLVLPYLRGIKRQKATYLLAKYYKRTSLPVKRRQEFRPFSDMI